MSGGHAVIVKALRDYSGRLNADIAVPNEVNGLVGDSDVGEKSWGVVGIFVKGKYTEMLGDLKGLLGEMANGLQAAGEKFNLAANAYDTHEDDSKQLLGEILKVLEDPAPSRTPKIGPKG